MSITKVSKAVLLEIANSNWFPHKYLSVNHNILPETQNSLPKTIS